MKLWTTEEIKQEEGVESIDNIQGYTYISQIDRFIRHEVDSVDYYQKGRSLEDLYVSSSSLQYINPEEGGSPRAFVDFIENGIEETKNMRMGTIIHQYHENKDSFVISLVPKPSEKAGEVADKIIQLVNDGEVYSNALVQFAIESVGYQSNWKMETRINKIIDLCDAYIQEVLSIAENNQIFVTASEMEPIIKACNAIEEHPVASKLAFHSNSDLTGEVSFKEMELIMDHTALVEEEEVVLKLKSKIDNVIIDTENRIIKIVDLKSSINGGMKYTTKFTYWKTYRQLAFYGKQVKNWLVANNFDLEGYVFEFYIISVQTIGLGECTVFKIPKRYIVDGMGEVKCILNRIAYHVKNNQWKWSIEEVNNNFVIDMPYVENSQD